MRSQSRKIGTAVLLPLMLWASLGLSGCQVGRTFFRMDSNAPIPFFGMDLLPKRDKTSPTDGVSRFQSETVSRQGERAPGQSEPIVMRELPSQPSASPPSVSQPSASRGWSSLLGRTPKTEALALPVGRTTESDGTTSDAPVEQFR